MLSRSNASSFFLSFSLCFSLQTFLLDESAAVPYEHLAIWEDVHATQKAALSAARAGAMTWEVDEAAREVLSYHCRRNQ